MISVDKVLRARGKMLRNKANGTADCLVTEMLRCLPTETIQEVAKCRASEAWKFLRLVFLKKSPPSFRTTERFLQMVHDRLGGHAP